MRHTGRKLPAVPGLVAIDLPGGDAFVAALTLIWARGDAALPLDQRLPRPAQQVILDHLRPSAVIDAQGEYPYPGQNRQNRQDRHVHPTEPGDALVVATSGTTGRPKGVVLTHQAVEASAQATTRRLGVDPTRHRWLACLPLNHVGGLSVITRAVVTNTPLTVLPGFDAGQVEATATPDTFVSLVATALQRIDPSRFHTIVLGGSTPPPELPPNAVSTYGLTETGSGVVYDGVPLDGVEIRIDPETNEVHIRGPMLLRAYRTATEHRDPKDPQGWFATGDSGHQDLDTNRLHIDGRLSDLIITGGENVWPAPVAAAITQHPKVKEAVVAGRSDEEWGQRVVAWVVPVDPDDPPSLDELRDTVKQHRAAHEAPKQLIVTTELPKTALGKIRQDDLPLP